MTDDFTTPPPELPTPPPPQLGPAPTGTDQTQAGALLELWQVQKTVLVGRAIAGAAVSVVGLIIASAVVCVAIHTTSQAWDERTVFGAGGQSERLKYLVAFLTFKATALGGALTAGLLLIRAGNRLSGGADGKDVDLKVPSLGD